jgi:hypothetical protein
MTRHVAVMLVAARRYIFMLALDPINSVHTLHPKEMFPLCLKKTSFLRHLFLA